MDMARASQAPIQATLGGTSRSLRRLSRRDFGAIIARMPGDEERRAFYSVFDVHRWAPTATGSAVVIGIASLPASAPPADVEARIAEVRDSGQWGSLTEQATVAGCVTAESLTLPDTPQGERVGEGEQRPDPTTPATTSTRRG